MSEYRIRLQDRYTSVFGVVAKNAIPLFGNVGISNITAYGVIVEPSQIDPSKAPDTSGTTPYGNQEVYPGLEGVEFGDLGNPIFDMLTLEHPSLPDRSFAFRYPVMITPSREPNISTTIVNENFEAGIQPGEVIESFGWKPWRISIRGLMVDVDNSQFPLDQVGQLNRAIRINDTYKVVSLFLNELDIFEVYVSGAVQFTPSKDFKDTCEFQITLSSHEPIEALTLNS